MGTLKRAWTWVFSGTLVPPLTGLICRMVGAVAVQVCTSIPLFTVRVCDPVWICTVRKPVVAPEVTRLAVRLVAPLTVTGPKVPAGAPPTAIPGPKLAFVVGLTQLVNAPVITTLSVCVGLIVFGLIKVTAGTPAITVNVAGADSAPVVMVTVRAPVTATLSIVIGTDALVGPFTVSVPAVMLAPKLTVVVAPKWVLVPVITIVSLAP